MKKILIIVGVIVAVLAVTAFVFRDTLQFFIMMQAMALGELKTLSEGRYLLQNSFTLKEYKPQDVALWDKEYKKKNP